MPTFKQKKLARIVLENPSLMQEGRKGELVEKGGYSIATQKQPGKVLESKGFIEELENYGLTEELIKSALVDDIKGKPKKRYAELSLGAEILGMKKEKPNGNTFNFINVISPEQTNRIARRIIDGDKSSEEKSD